MPPSSVRRENARARACAVIHSATLGRLMMRLSMFVELLDIAV